MVGREVCAHEVADHASILSWHPFPVEYFGIAFVGHYDQARSAIKNIVDMPDRKLDRLIQFLHQNQGILSKTKRHFFDELHDAEIAGIEAAYRQAFSGVRGETVPTES